MVKLPVSRPLRLSSKDSIIDQKGITSLFFLVTFPSILVLFALVVDIGILMSAKARAQTAADATASGVAHTIGYVLRGNPSLNSEEIQTILWARWSTLYSELLERNGVSPDAAEVEIVGPAEVAVRVSLVQPLFFAKAIGLQEVTVSALGLAKAGAR